MRRVKTGNAALDKDSHRYDDMINLPHHQSETRPHMSLLDRAAQFSPFAALTGYEDVIKETSRLTDDRIELSEEVQLELSSRLTFLREHIEDHPTAKLTYFVPDPKKSGGSYVTTVGGVRRIDEYKRVIQLDNGENIQLDDIVELSVEYKNL